MAQATQELKDNVVLLQARTLSAEQERDYLRARYAGVEPEIIQFQQV
jgi:hypothetical protein